MNSQAIIPSSSFDDKLQRKMAEIQQIKQTYDDQTSQAGTEMERVESSSGEGRNHSQQDSDDDNIEWRKNL